MLDKKFETVSTQSPSEPFFGCHVACHQKMAVRKTSFQSVYCFVNNKIEQNSMIPSF